MLSVRALRKAFKDVVAVDGLYWKSDAARLRQRRVFSSQKSPAAMQPFIEALPLTAVINALRTHMLQGANLWQLAPQIAVIVAWLLVCFALAMKLCRWR